MPTCPVLQTHTHNYIPTHTRIGGMKTTVGHQLKSDHLTLLAIRSIHNRPYSQMTTKLEVIALLLAGTRVIT